MSRAKNSQIIVAAALATATPLANGTAAVGVSVKAAREDHVHPIGYKVYSALLTQTGTSDPTVTILENTTGLVFTWTRNQVGVYFTNPLPGDLTKSVINFPLMTNSSDTIFRSGKDWDSKGNNTVFSLRTYNGFGDVPADTQMDKAFVEIRLYD